MANWYQFLVEALETQIDVQPLLVFDEQRPHVLHVRRRTGMDDGNAFGVHNCMVPSR